MLKINGGAAIRRANVRWQANKAIAATIARRPMMCRKPRFNAIASTLRAPST